MLHLRLLPASLARIAVPNTARPPRAGAAWSFSAAALKLRLEHHHRDQTNLWADGSAGSLLFEHGPKSYAAVGLRRFKFHALAADTTQSPPRWTYDAATGLITFKPSAATYYVAVTLREDATP